MRLPEGREAACKNAGTSAAGANPQPAQVTDVRPLPVDEGWLLETRRWALFSWAFLTIGILLGGWWSYEVLGWSGVWAWDPVENASLLPWLTATAYIHSVLLQERRGMLRVWNLATRSFTPTSSTAVT